VEKNPEIFNFLPLNLKPPTLSRNKIKDYAIFIIS
jgi:hypothetical protein